MIPQTQFLTDLDGKEFYYQQLLWQIPFQDDRAILTTGNVTRTFKEECYLRGLFDYQDEVDKSLKEMKDRNFDPTQISRVARKMLIQEIAPLGVLKKKILDMDYAEVIPLDDDDTNLVQYPTISVDDYYDNETDQDIKNFLILTDKQFLMKQKIFKPE